MQKMALEDDVAHLRQDVNNLICSQAQQEAIITNQTELLARIANVLEVKFDKQPPTTPTLVSESTSDVIMLFSDSIKTSRSDHTIEQIFVKYFTDHCLEGWEIEKNSNSFKT
jgi:hypothetical protein